MSDITVIHNARLLGMQEQPSERYKVTIEKGRVSAVEPMHSAFGKSVDRSEGADCIDVAGDWITLGAVDLQINGALGLAFPDLRSQNFETLEQICDLLWQQGVDSFCPTLVTTSLENFHGALSAIQQFQQQQKDTPRTAKILGAHLEGPFLNVAKRGAHPEQFIQPLSLNGVKEVVGEFANVISIMTLAPEDMAGGIADETVVPWLREQNIVVSLGHSLATAEQATQAFEQGASMVTHAFNAMPGLHHREPGMLGAALTSDRVHIGFIADGEHICPTMLDLLLRANRGHDRLFLVSDALSPLGLPDGVYPWDEREIEVINGTARLADGTLSGTTLSLIKGAQNLVEWGLCDVEEAIALLTEAPRRAINEANSLEGNTANLIRWHHHADKQLSWQRLNNA